MNRPIYLYDEVMRKLLNNQNMFDIIHNLLYLKINEMDKLYYSIGNILNIMDINFRVLKGAGYMIDLDEKIVSDSRSLGYYMREKYKVKGSENKLNGICYKLLNALKTNNINMFMDVLLNCYLYIGDSVPKVFTEILMDGEKFRTVGYAFVAGMIDGRWNGDKRDKGEVE